MSTLQDDIRSLSHDDARRVLAVFADNQPDHASHTLPAAIPVPVLDTAQQAELARETLLVLAGDPQHRRVIEALATGPAPQRYDIGLGSGAAILAAVVFVLRTHIKYERKADGQWVFRIEHKPADSTVLKALLDKLSTLLPTVGDQ